MEKSIGILSIWQSAREEKAGIWIPSGQEVNKENEHNRARIFRVAFPRGGRRVRQSVFVIKGDFSIEKTDEYFLSDDS